MWPNMAEIKDWITHTRFILKEIEYVNQLFTLLAFYNSYILRVREKCIVSTYVFLILFFCQYFLCWGITQIFKSSISTDRYVDNGGRYFDQGIFLNFAHFFRQNRVNIVRKIWNFKIVIIRLNWWLIHMIILIQYSLGTYRNIMLKTFRKTKLSKQYFFIPQCLKTIKGNKFGCCWKNELFHSLCGAHKR